jgi:IS605 OrfB family transposase
MTLTAEIKLMPTREQAAELSATLKRTNEACNAIAAFAFDAQIFSQFDIHRVRYLQVKGLYELPSQLTIRCIGKVAHSYSVKKDKERHFRPLSAIPYDARCLSFKPAQQTVSLRTLHKRQTISYVMGEHAGALMKYQKGESDLCTRNGHWYLKVSCQVPEAEMQDLKEMLGVDLGICQIAATSDGKGYSGAKIEKVRKRYQRRRTALQKVGTKSAKRRLKKIAGKEKRFRKDVNHIISKQIVMVAERTGRGIVLEDLKGIRDRLRVRKADRARFSGWSFSQLRLFISYKAQRIGIPVVLVNPKYTSQCCNACLHIEKGNRKSQAEFKCWRCGHEDNADSNAAKNIQLLGQNQRSYGRDVGFIRH